MDALACPSHARREGNTRSLSPWGYAQPMGLREGVTLNRLYPMTFLLIVTRNLRNPLALWGEGDLPPDTPPPGSTGPTNSRAYHMNSRVTPVTGVTRARFGVFSMA